MGWDVGILGKIPGLGLREDLELRVSGYDQIRPSACNSP